MYILPCSPEVRSKTDAARLPGAAYTSNVVVPRGNFKVTKGKPKDYDAKGNSGKINKHWVRLLEFIRPDPSRIAD